MVRLGPGVRPAAAAPGVVGPRAARSPGVALVVLASQQHRTLVAAVYPGAVTLGRPSSPRCTTVARRLAVAFPGE